MKPEMVADLARKMHGDEVMEEMLSETGKKMLQTNVVYVLADPETSPSKNVVQSLRHSSSIKLQLEFNLEIRNASSEHVKHDFTLKPEKVSLSIVRYGNGDSPINESVIVPENAPGCLKD